jgi:hypothetical protein
MVSDWVSIEPAAFAMALINEYRPGAPIGWHSDAPQYELVAGVSLLSSCRMKFRPYVRPKAVTLKPGRRVATHVIELERRSAYLMTAEARHDYEHHIPAVKDLRLHHVSNATVLELNLDGGARRKTPREGGSSSAEGSHGTVWLRRCEIRLYPSRADRLNCLIVD